MGMEFRLIQALRVARLEALPPPRYTQDFGRSFDQVQHGVEIRLAVHQAENPSGPDHIPDHIPTRAELPKAQPKVESHFGRDHTPVHTRRRVNRLFVPTPHTVAPTHHPQKPTTLHILDSRKISPSTGRKAISF